MSKVSAIGIDLAKNTFQLHGVDAQGKPARHRFCVKLSNEPRSLTFSLTCRSEALSCRHGSVRQFYLAVTRWTRVIERSAPMVIPSRESIQSSSSLT
jgi:hypothetical protein